MARKQTKRLHTVFSEASDERSWTTMLARLMNLIGTPALIFMAWTVWDGMTTLTKEVASMKTSIAVVSTELKNASDDRYRASQAAADLKLRDVTIEAIDKRLVAAEGRLSAVELRVSAITSMRPALP